MRGWKACVAAALLVVGARMAGAQAPSATDAASAGVPPFDRIAGALALVDLRAVAQYDFTVNAWPRLGVTPWPLVTSCRPASQMGALLADMEAALTRQDIPAALEKGRSLAYAARDAGLGVTAIGIAETVAQYAELQADANGRQRMAELIRELEIRRGATPEYSSQGVPQWLLALKPQTLFVGTVEAVRALGIAGVQMRFANMLDIVSQDMAVRRDLKLCAWHPEAPDHLIRDYWVLIQRLRIDAGKLACSLADGTLDAVVGQVSYFNGSWGLVRQIAQASGCSTRGAYATWK